MQPAGACLMAGVAKLAKLVQYGRPGNLLEVILKSSRVANGLPTIGETSVMLGVDSFQAIGVSYCKNSFRLAVQFAAIVDFQLDAEVAAAFSVEDGFGFVIVIVNGAFAALGITSAAVGLVVIIVEIVGRIVVNDASTAAAGSVGSLIAAGTQGNNRITNIVIIVNARSAVLANHCSLVKTAIAIVVTIEHIKIFHRAVHTAGEAAFLLLHGILPPK